MTHSPTTTTTVTAATTATVTAPTGPVWAPGAVTDPVWAVYWAHDASTTRVVWAQDCDTARETARGLSIAFAAEIHVRRAGGSIDSYRYLDGSVSWADDFGA